MVHMSLNEMLKTLFSSGSPQYHICVHDVSGILKNRKLLIDKEYTMHSRDFCELAKSTEAGFELCLKCKKCCNRKAILKKRGFSGLCAFGLFEVVRPVIIDGKTVCIIYLGNIVIDREKTLEKLRRACHYSGNDLDAMTRSLRSCDTSLSAEDAERICSLVDSYIRLLYDKYKGDELTDSPYHWAVYNIKNYADENFGRSITLESVCRLYFINEKYSGKLFAEQVGMSFHEYLNKIRLEKAATELVATKDKIIDIAMRCGYSDVTYFNRKFRDKYGTTPGDFRKKVLGKNTVDKYNEM